MFFYFSEKIVCYWRPGLHGLTSVAQIQANLCSHILVSFLSFNASGELTNQIDIGNKAQLANELKLQNPDLKIFASIAVDVGRWSVVSADAKLSEIFAENLYQFLEKYNMDGIGEYFNYSILCQTLF
jgi:hypothetical protein